MSFWVCLFCSYIPEAAWLFQACTWPSLPKCMLDTLLVLQPAVRMSGVVISAGQMLFQLYVTSSNGGHAQVSTTWCIPWVAQSFLIVKEMKTLWSSWLHIWAKTSGHMECEDARSDCTYVALQEYPVVCTRASWLHQFTWTPVCQCSSIISLDFTIHVQCTIIPCFSITPPIWVSIYT